MCTQYIKSVEVHKSSPPTKVKVCTQCCTITPKFSVRHSILPPIPKRRNFALVSVSILLLWSHCIDFTVYKLACLLLHNVFLSKFCTYIVCQIKITMSGGETRPKCIWTQFLNYSMNWHKSGNSVRFTCTFTHWMITICKFNSPSVINSSIRFSEHNYLQK